MHYDFLCLIGDILPLCFFGERLRAREEECDGVYSISSSGPNLLCIATGSFEPLGNRSLHCFDLFLGDEFRLFDCLGVSAAIGSTEVVATDFPEVGAATLAADLGETGVEFCVHFSVSLQKLC